MTPPPSLSGRATKKNIFCGSLYITRISRLYWTDKWGSFQSTFVENRVLTPNIFYNQPIRERGRKKIAVDKRYFFYNFKYNQYFFLLFIFGHLLIIFCILNVFTCFYSEILAWKIYDVWLLNPLNYGRFYRPITHTESGMKGFLHIHIALTPFQKKSVLRVKSLKILTFQKMSELKSSFSNNFRKFLQWE